MQKLASSQFLPRAFLSTATYLTIFVLGLQYAYYLIFSDPTDAVYFDDEGNVILFVDFFIRSGGNYDVIGEYQYHGPFFFLVKYFIHYLSNTDISHNTNRLTTIAFWSLVSLVSAFFVHRVTRSLILAVIVQLQLIFLLGLLILTAGHPQDLSLLLITSALLFASYVGSRHSSVLPIAGMAVMVGALLLVKINLGIYLATSLAISLLLFLPPRKLAVPTFALAACAAVLLPVAVMGRFIFHNPLDLNYCLQVTLMVVACLVTCRLNGKGAGLRWADIGWAVLSVLGTVLIICAVAISLGSSLAGIVDTVLLRAVKLSASVKDHAPVTYSDVNFAIASVVIAIGYRLVAPKLEASRHWLIALAALKLCYGIVTMYGMYTPPRLDLSFRALSFIWLVLIPPHPAPTNVLSTSFARVFLCFTAAFQAMQAFPVAGAQLQWSILLLAPLAAICIGDALSFLWMEFGGRWSKAAPASHQQSQGIFFQLAGVSLIVFLFWQKMGIEQLRATYLSRPSLGIAGADRFHFPEKVKSEILAVVDTLKEQCDGFVAIPGMPSLYYWTGIQPPAVVTDYWVLNMAVDQQNRIIDAMGKYENPCMVYHPWKLKVWARDAWDIKEEIPQLPGMKYMNDQYTLIRRIGAYRIMRKKDDVSR